MKKILAFILVAVMAIGLIPAAALTSSADAPVVDFYPSVIVGESNGVNTATIVGTVDKESIGDLDRIEMSFSISGDASKEVGPITFNSVYNTINGVASNNEELAASEGIVYVESGDVYLYALRIKGIPAGNYTINAAVTAYDNNNAPVEEASSLDGVPFLVPTEEQKTVLAAYRLAKDETMTGVTMTGVVSAINEISERYGNATFFFIVAGLVDNPIEAYRVKGATGVDINDLEIGATVTVSGDVTNYNGTIEFKNTSLIDSITAPLRTDAEKVQIEYNNLSITPAQGTVLPAAGTKYTEVAITWASDNAVVAVDEGVIAVDNSTLTESVDVTLTATLTLNDATLTKNFTIGVSAPAGEQTVSKSWTLTFPDGNDKANTNYTGTWTATIEDQTWTLTAINNGGGSSGGWEAVRAGSKNDKSVATVTTTISGTVQNVVLNLTQVNADKTNSIKLYVKNGDTTVATVDIDSVSVGEHTFVVPATAQAAGLTYVLEFDLQKDSNGFTRFDSVVYSGFVTASSGEPTVSDEDKVLAEYDALDVTVEDGAVLPTAGATYGDVVITWSSDNEMVYISDNTVYIVNILEEGDDDVTVTLTALLSCGEESIDKTFTVTLEAPASQDDPTSTTITLTFPGYNDKGVTSYTAEWTATVEDQVWTLKNFNNNNNSSSWTYVRCGSKNAESVATIATTVEGTVEQLTLTIDSVNAAKVNSIKLIVTQGDNSKTYDLDIEVGTQTIEIAAADRLADATYTFEFDCQKGSANGFVQISEITATVSQDQ